MEFLTLYSLDFVIADVVASKKPLWRSLLWNLIDLVFYIEILMTIRRVMKGMQ